MKRVACSMVLMLALCTSAFAELPDSNIFSQALNQAGITGQLTQAQVNDIVLDAIDAGISADDILTMSQATGINNIIIQTIVTLITQFSTDTIVQVARNLQIDEATISAGLGKGTGRNDPGRTGGPLGGAGDGDGNNRPFASPSIP